MKTVYLHSWQSRSLEDSPPPAWSQPPLFRRMTPLQKSVLLAFAALFERAPELQGSAAALKAPIFFCSAYGELSAMFGVVGSIAQGILPVSPKDFQHSVLNAALAYLTMSQQWHQGAFAFSGGYSSVDATLYLASQRIAGGLDHCSFVVHAAEADPGKREEARAELLFLSDSPGHREHLILESISWQRQENEPSHREGTQIFREEDDPSRIPWMLDDHGPALRRAVLNRQKQLIAMKWKTP